MNHQNNYAGRPNWLLDYQNCLQYYSSCLNIAHNYFDGPIKLLSDLAMFLDISTINFNIQKYLGLSV